MNRKKLFIVFFVLSAILIWFDHFTKNLAVASLKDKPAIVLIKGILELSYLENRGAAFGMLQGAKLLFLVISIIVVIGIIYVVYKLPLTKRFIPLFISLVFIFSGAIGNQIDRIINGYVVDFIYISVINFPVFNVADIYVTVSTTALAILFAFVYKEKEISFIKWL